MKSLPFQDVTRYENKDKTLNDTEIIIIIYLGLIFACVYVSLFIRIE